MSERVFEIVIHNDDGTVSAGLSRECIWNKPAASDIQKWAKINGMVLVPVEPMEAMNKAFLTGLRDARKSLVKGAIYEAGMGFKEGYKAMIKAAQESDI